MPNLGIDSRVTVTGLSVSPELAPFAECIATLDSTLFFYIKDSFSLSDSLTRSLLHSIIHSYSAPRCRPHCVCSLLLPFFPLPLLPQPLLTISTFYSLLLSFCSPSYPLRPLSLPLHSSSLSSLLRSHSDGPPSSPDPPPRSLLHTYIPPRIPSRITYK